MLCQKKFKKENQAFTNHFLNFFNAYTKAFNKKYERTGSLFQEHLKRIKIENEDYLRNLIIYVNTNPTHHSMANYIDYEYSSCKGLISGLPTLLKREEVLNLFEDVDNFKYVLRHKKLTDEVPEKLFLGDQTQQVSLLYKLATAGM